MSEYIVVLVVVAVLICGIAFAANGITANVAAANNSQAAIERQVTAQVQAHEAGATERLQTVALAITGMTAMVLSQRALEPLIYLVGGVLAAGAGWWIGTRKV